MIKFRAWDKKTKSFINDCDIVLDLISGKVYAGDIGLTDSINDVTDQIVLMQSTGFKDNNDTEVFEGDVINIHWFYADFDPVELGAFENEEYAERVIVKKEFGSFGFWWEEADSWVDLATLAMSARLDEESFEILGNIYENAELLKGAIK